MVAPTNKMRATAQLMRERNYRHLPVVDGAHVVGMVSVRDLYVVDNTELEQDLKDRNAFIYGETYGTAGNPPAPTYAHSTASQFTLPVAAILA